MIMYDQSGKPTGQTLMIAQSSNNNGGDGDWQAPPEPNYNCPTCKKDLQRIGAPDATSDIEAEVPHWLLGNPAAADQTKLTHIVKLFYVTEAAHAS